MYLLLRGNDDFNQWLEDNPLVLGGGAIVLGLIMVALGAGSLITGKATGKYGYQMKGGHAYAMGMVRLIFGIACCGFGLYKLVSGLM